MNSQFITGCTVQSVTLTTNANMSNRLPRWFKDNCEIQRDYFNVTSKSTAHRRRKASTEGKGLKYHTVICTGINLKCLFVKSDFFEHAFYDSSSEIDESRKVFDFKRRVEPEIPRLCQIRTNCKIKLTIGLKI